MDGRRRDANECTVRAFEQEAREDQGMAP